MTDLVRTLEGIVGAERVDDGAASRYAVDGVAPAVAVFPGSIEEVSAVLSACSGAKAAVVPRGGGVHMGLGGVPRKVDVVLGLGRLREVIDHEPGDMTSTVRAGMPLDDYQKQLGRHGQFLGLDPPGASGATIGGILAANLSGPRRVRYGTARDLLIGLRVVNASGTVTKGGAKVVKNVTGYDMPKLYVGSLGTLGVIVEATFRLYPVPECERTWIASFPTAAKACEVIARLLNSPLVPGAVELLSETAARAVGEGCRAISGLGGVLLAVAVASLPATVEAQIRAVRAMAETRGGDLVLEDVEQGAFWSGLRGLETSFASDMVLKASVLTASVAEIMEGGERLAVERGLAVAFVAEAATGIVRCCLRGGENENRMARLADMVVNLRALAAKARGSVVVLTAPREVKLLVDVWGSVGNGFPLMRSLKEQFDPGGILNPGRFVGGL